MRIVVAPDSFKGTLTAVEAARSVAEGWASVRPDDEVIVRPMADGGEGTLDAFASLPESEVRAVEVVDAVGRQRNASWVLLPDGTAVVELAACCGIVGLHPLAPREAHTLGFGMAIRAAIEAGARRLLLAIGGSASTDGGVGLLVGLGLRVSPDPFVSAAADDGRTVLDFHAPDPDGPGWELDWSDVVAPPDGGAVILSDVTNPLLGATGAAAVFGPQKGGGEIVDALEARLEAWAAALGGDPDAPGAGAAGGAGFALQRWGATTVSGAAAVADAVGLREAIDGADLVITGEGRFDSQSAAGKVVSLVRELAGEGRTMVVAGCIDAAVDGLAGAVSLTELAGDRALSHAAESVVEAGRRLAETVG